MGNFSRMMRAALALAALGLASLPAAVGAAGPKSGTWEGDTSQAGVMPAQVAFVVTRKARFVKNVSFNWRAYCSHGGSVDDSTAIDALRIWHSHHRLVFGSDDTYTSKVPGKPLKEKVTESIHGRFITRRRVRGTLRIELDLLNPAAGNAVVDHCSSDAVTWKATQFKRGLL